MATQVVMPKLSPTMEEGQIARWLKKEGDKVSMGEPIAEIDTDKATMEMQALGAGVLRKILVQEGESAPLGQLIGIIAEPDEDIAELTEQAGATKAEAEAAGGNGQATARVKEKAKAEPEEAEEEEAVEEEPKEQVEEKAPEKARTAEPREKQAKPAAEKPEAERQQEAPREEGKRVLVSPLAARMAAEAGIDLRSISGTGPAGRIVKRDVEAAISSKEEEKPKRPSHLRAVERVEPLEQPEIEGASPYFDKPAPEIRRVIARRLVTSLGPVPHFFLTTEIEMDRAIEMRRSINELDSELKISVNDIIIKVVAAALMQHPQVNASFQEKNIRYYESADIGVAVAIEDGLITPVVRSAERKSLSEIAGEMQELAERARSRKLKPEEYTGATFSVSNLGMFGIDDFTAVINPPEGGILAVGAATPKPVVRDGEIVIRQIMRVTMSCDHRVIDGATGARFLQTFKKIMENPLYLIV